MTLLIGAFFIEQSAARIRVTRSNVEARAVTPMDGLQPLYRDMAAALEASKHGPIVLLASPNASTAIGYFGRIETLASLYWENMDGVETAARIFSATSDDSAFALLRARGVTHIVSMSANDFLQQYLELARPASAPDELRRTFGYRLLTGSATPRWLRPIPFRPRFPTPGDNRALLFEVDPSQTDLEHAWNMAVAAVAAGHVVQAEREFHDLIDHVASERRAGLYQTAGQTAYRWQEHALAVRLLDTAMAIHATKAGEENLAWILATSTDDRVRNGRAALERATRLERAYPADATTLDVLAAALAEDGRFGDAVAVAQRMAMLAAADGDRAGVGRANERLAAYRSGQPWRQ